MRNELIFDLTGGSGADRRRPTSCRSSSVDHRQQVIVDITTARPDVRELRHQRHLHADRDRDRQDVVTGQTFARVSSDNPGQQQRFARARGQRDAENRAAKVIADNIRSRASRRISSPAT